MIHTPLLGKAIASASTEPLISFGKKALEDCKTMCRQRQLSRVALDIIITAGLVSNFTVHENNPNPEEDYYYNSSLAHCVYYRCVTLSAM